MDCLYTLSPGVTWRLLDGEAVVYVGDRFETHLLDPASSWLIAALQGAGEPCLLSDISRQFFSDETLGQAPARDADADADLLSPVLNQLVQHGILSKSLC